MNKVVFLYTEIADYFLKCLEACGDDFQFLVIHWPVNKEAPFQFQTPQNSKLVSKAGLTKRALLELVQKFEPNLICCSGWIDKDYIAIVRKLKSSKTRTCISLDNHWNNSIKQKTATIISRFTIIRYFDFAWVPGNIQKEYALKLGFKPSQIQLGYYCADTLRFTEVYENRTAILNSDHIPKVILFVGRYVVHKGIFDLWHAFIKLKKETKNEWELWCIGTGAEWENKIEHPSIKHFGFKQPNELLPFLMQASVYVLPSHFEPWGVSVHEMALSGFPLILSNKVGAAEKFLMDKENGYLFQVSDENSLLDQLRHIMTMQSEAILKMSKKSHEIGLRLNHNDWRASLYRLIEK
jgi:glycosyltransferase involved in cell wall biosynthesis